MGLGQTILYIVIPISVVAYFLMSDTTGYNFALKVNFIANFMAPLLAYTAVSLLNIPYLFSDTKSTMLEFGVIAVLTFGIVYTIGAISMYKAAKDASVPGSEGKRTCKSYKMSSAMLHGTKIAAISLLTFTVVSFVPMLQKPFSKITQQMGVEDPQRTAYGIIGFYMAFMSLSGTSLAYFPALEEGCRMNDSEITDAFNKGYPTLDRLKYQNSQVDNSPPPHDAAKKPKGILDKLGFLRDQKCNSEWGKLDDKTRKALEKGESEGAAAAAAAATVSSVFKVNYRYKVLKNIPNAVLQSTRSKKPIPKDTILIINVIGAARLTATIKSIPAGSAGISIGQKYTIEERLAKGALVLDSTALKGSDCNLWATVSKADDATYATFWQNASLDNIKKVLKEAAGKCGWGNSQLIIYDRTTMQEKYSTGRLTYSILPNFPSTTIPNNIYLGQTTTTRKKFLVKGNNKKWATFASVKSNNATLNELRQNSGGVVAWELRLDVVAQRIHNAYKGGTGHEFEVMKKDGTGTIPAASTAKVVMKKDGTGTIPAALTAKVVTKKPGGGAKKIANCQTLATDGSATCLKCNPGFTLNSSKKGCNTMTPLEIVQKLSGAKAEEYWNYLSKKRSVKEEDACVKAVPSFASCADKVKYNFMNTLISKGNLPELIKFIGSMPANPAYKDKGAAGLKLEISLVGDTCGANANKECLLLEGWFGKASFVMVADKRHKPPTAVLPTPTYKPYWRVIWPKDVGFTKVKLGMLLGDSSWNEAEMSIHENQVPIFGSSAQRGNAAAFGSSSLDSSLRRVPANFEFLPVTGSNGQYYLKDGGRELIGAYTKFKGKKLVGFTGVKGIKPTNMTNKWKIKAVYHTT